MSKKSMDMYNFSIGVITTPAVQVSEDSSCRFGLPPEMTGTVLLGCTGWVNTDPEGTPVATQRSRTACDLLVPWFEQGSWSVGKFSCCPPYRSPMFGARMARWNCARILNVSSTRQSMP